MSAHRVDALPLPRWKRAMDMAVAGTTLVVLSPVIVLVAAVIALTMGRPVLFRQQRLGLGGAVFDIIKFRTMTDGRDERGDLLDDDQRRTRLGNLLRKTTLDELPTLLNVVRGDMSLVGPRPLLAHYGDRYTPEQAQRHRVTPGLTGLAQTRGRNILTWDERFALDLEYVENRSLTTDLRILKDTLAILVLGTGADDHTTEFMGTDPARRSPSRSADAA
jgi:lipopolysaccharide/colanic/teichoic acid biosynthesis glycosyltransferase